MKKEITINEIIEKRIELEEEIKKILNNFYSETSIKVKGEIFYLHEEDKPHIVSFSYTNPIA